MRAPNIDFDVAQECIRDIVIPAQPQLMLDIRNVYPDIDKIAALIARDPAMGAAVLKTVNSPLFGIPKKIVKIEQAVMLLGLDSVMNIMSALLLRKSLANNIDPSVLNEFWQSANDAAVAINFVARQLKLVSPDQAFILGLFHNCAIPLMREKYQDYFDTLVTAYQEHRRTLTDLEDEHYQANHALIGGYIARAWHLPEDVITVIGEHHLPSRLSADIEGEATENVDILCALLKFTEHLIGEHKALGSDDCDYEWEQYQNAILARLDLSEDDALSLAEEAMEAVHAADLNFG